MGAARHVAIEAVGEVVGLCLCLCMGVGVVRLEKVRLMGMGMGQRRHGRVSIIPRLALAGTRPCVLLEARVNWRAVLLVVRVVAVVDLHGCG